MTPEHIQGHNMAINAKVVACQIRCEGMKVENAQRFQQGYAFAYDDAAFEEVAVEVDRLAASFITE